MKENVTVLPPDEECGGKGTLNHIQPGLRAIVLYIEKISWTNTGKVSFPTSDHNSIHTNLTVTPSPREVGSTG